MKNNSFTLSLAELSELSDCIAILADISGMQEAEKMIRKPLCNFERPKRTLKHQIMAKKLRDKLRGTSGEYERLQIKSR